eukprot:TRINITY_DN886_c0_g1_i5.p2 TRINITY_DN886_c0_g1~~TRINITY_DN886_c0_g1_i5.p2  ORF type:complete len:103 (-),score=11.27 TRINITY_DN886_c0_g1_i5:6-314(-)
MVLFTVAELGVCSVHAPPAKVTLQGPWQYQTPTALRLMANLPQGAQKCLECCEISIFLARFRRLAPYRVPYLPVMPTFTVRLPILLAFLSCVHKVSNKVQKL